MPVAAAVHAYQTDAPLARSPCGGSPGSARAATVVPETLPCAPESAAADANESFAGGVPKDQWSTTVFAGMSPL